MQPIADGATSQAWLTVGRRPVGSPVGGWNLQWKSNLSLTVHTFVSDGAFFQFCMAHDFSMINNFNHQCCWLLHATKM